MTAFIHYIMMHSSRVVIPVPASNMPGQGFRGIPQLLNQGYEPHRRDSSSNDFIWDRGIHLHSRNVLIGAGHRLPGSDVQENAISIMLNSLS